MAIDAVEEVEDGAGQAPPRELPEVLDTDDVSQVGHNPGSHFTV